MPGSKGKGETQYLTLWNSGSSKGENNAMKKACIKWRKTRGEREGLSGPEGFKDSFRDVMVLTISA